MGIKLNILNSKWGFGVPEPARLEKFSKFTQNFQIQIYYFEVMIFCLLADFKPFFEKNLINFIETMLLDIIVRKLIRF